MTLLILLIVVFVGANVADHYDLREGEYHGPWWRIIIQWFVNAFHIVDQGINSLVLFGHPNETISSRIGRKKDTAWYWWVSYYLVGLLFFMAKVDFDHCRRYIGS